jgi:hypothetical protein
MENSVLSAGEKPFICVPRVRDTWSNINADGALAIKVKRDGAIQNEADSRIVYITEVTQNNLVWSTG